MLITLINPLSGDILKRILTMIIEGRFYFDTNMCTTFISYDYPRYLGVDLARPHCLVSQSNHTYSL